MNILHCLVSSKCLLQKSGTAGLYKQNYLRISYDHYRPGVPYRMEDCYFLGIICVDKVPPPYKNVNVSFFLSVRRLSELVKKGLSRLKYRIIFVYTN
jgi:hypothetical protein